ncbi:uncharacterized protein V6R79_016143 [Siganus canaliculatus]
MSRYAAFVFLLASGFVFQQTHGVEVNIKSKDDKLCLYANLTASFSVSYEVTGNKTSTVMIELPSDVTTSGSECGDTASMLKLNFGAGHSWSMNFSASQDKYQAEFITFSYNLTDAATFPESALTGIQTVTVKPHITDVALDTCYLCHSKDTIEDESVNQTLWNVLIQAFVSNGSKSEQNTVCAADVPTTTVSPTTHTSPTTTAPVTNSTGTTAPPTTPTTTPSPTLPTPTVGQYSIKPDENSTACLLASFGLRVGIQHADKYEEMNLVPNATSVTGTCGVNSSELVLTSDTMTFTFTFINDSKKFRLHALNVTGTTSSGASFSEANTNLSLWEAAVSSSYMCSKEQNITITSSLTLFTFELHVQPFGVKKGDFSTAHECSLDDISLLIPIIVGAALGGLILIVVIAYVIGRRKTYVGYQTL